MNRWLEVAKQVQTNHNQDIQRRTNATAAYVQSGVCHSVFAPMHYEINYAYPLVVWLHGSTDDERQLNVVMPHMSLRNYVGIAPRGTRPSVESDEHGCGYGWCQDPDDILLSEHRVCECIELAKSRFSIHPRRIFLVGYGSGGTMALRLGLANPGEYAGIVSIGGKFPTGHTPLIHIEQARPMPLLLTHGRQSESFSEEDVCKALRLIHSAGMSVTLRQYPGADEITTKLLGDVDTWLMEVVTGDRQAALRETDQQRFVDWN